jgi:FkbM family methyltransferase
VLGTGRDFRKLFSPRHFRQGAWSVANLRNWPSAIAGGLWDTSLTQIRFRNGLRFKVESGDLTPLYEVFSDRVYDRPFRGIASDGTILDIGGNIGAFTVMAASDLVPRGMVITVEPNPKCLQRIEENLALNRIGNVRVIQGAVTTAVGNVEFHAAAHTGNSTLFPDGRIGDSARMIVPAISPRDVLGLADSYELVKVDCEGGEFALLYETTPEDWKGIKRLALEYHIGFDKKYPANPEQLQQRIEELGFEILCASSNSEIFGYIAAVQA